MEYKKGLVFICLLICLFSIASVCASDVNETVMANENQSDDLTIEDNSLCDIVTKQEELNEITHAVKNDTCENNIIFSNDNLEINYTDPNSNELNKLKDYNNNVELTYDHIFYDSYGFDLYENSYSSVKLNGNNHKIINFYLKVQRPNLLIENIIFEHSNIYVGHNNCTINNCTFLNCNNPISNGGAICIAYSRYASHVNNCVFINNTARYGGAIYTNGYPGIKDCIFINNTDFNGYGLFAEGDYGKFYISGGGAVINSSIKYNPKTYSTASGIWWGNTDENYNVKPNTEFSISSWYFLDLKTNKNLIITGDKVLITCKLYSRNDNKDYNYSSSEKLNLNLKSNKDDNSIPIPFSNGKGVIEYSTNQAGNITLYIDFYGVIIKSFNIEFYDLINTDVSIPEEVTISNDESLVLIFPNDATGTITLNINGKNYNFNIVNGTANVEVPDLSNGDYTYAISYSGDDKYASFTRIGSLNVNKIIPTLLTAAQITTVYNGGKYLVITLKDTSGNVIKGNVVSINLNGKLLSQATDSNGQVKFSTNGLAPKIYTASITFAGNGNYAKSSTTAKVTVTKATPKITAKAKTFKKSLRTKKYTITLKDNKGKVMKKAKVTIKIKGKTYKATTNSKGKATFKIKKLTKKGKYKVTVTYKGNNCYNKVTQKVKITVK